METKWTLAELTELDLRLRPSADPEVPDTWHPEPEADPSSTLLKWLRDTRRSDPKASDLAQSAVRAETWFRLAWIILSTVAGLGAASGLLRSGGEQLINVSAYLGVLVGGQLLMLLLLALSGIWLRSRVGLREELLLPKIIRELPNPQSFPAWRWRLFTTFQLGGAAFNFGILAATLWKVVAFDLAFGWATTLRVDAESVVRLTRLLSLPWGGATAPTLEQVANSRIVLLEGFSMVNPDSTASWWPFLMLCVTAYGLIPRMLLTGLGALKIHSCLRHPRLSSPEAQHLVQRLTRRVLHYRSSESSIQPATAASRDVPALTPTRPMFPVIPEDLGSAIALPRFLESLQNTFPIELAENREGSGRLFVVEAWQPPLEETLRSFRLEREQTGPESEFLILAVGLPDDQGGFLPPAPEDLNVWKQKLAEIRDPRLGLLAWEPTP